MHDRFNSLIYSLKRSAILFYEVSLGLSLTQPNFVLCITPIKHCSHGKQRARLLWQSILNCEITQIPYYKIEARNIKQ